MLTVSNFSLRYLLYSIWYTAFSIISGLKKKTIDIVQLKRLKLRKNNWNSDSYRFDEVFTVSASQKRVYEVVAKPVVEVIEKPYVMYSRVHHSIYMLINLSSFTFSLFIFYTCIYICYMIFFL